MSKIINTTELTLVCEEKAYEKDNHVYTYYEYYVLCLGVKVPFEVKGKNLVGIELLKQKLLRKEIIE